MQWDPLGSGQWPGEGAYVAAFLCMFHWSAIQLEEFPPGEFPCHWQPRQDTENDRGGSFQSPANRHFL